MFHTHRVKEHKAAISRAEKREISTHFTEFFLTEIVPGTHFTFSHIKKLNILNMGTNSTSKI